MIAYFHFSSSSPVQERRQREELLYGHILTSLVAGSGIDWNEDEELRSVVLSVIKQTS